MRRKLLHAHRYVGVFCALFVVMLAVTGMLLNHTEDLALDERKVTSDIVLDFYGIDAPKIEHGFSVESQWFSRLGEAIYINSLPVVSDSDQIVGAFKSGDIYVAATQSELILINSEGLLIERLSSLHGVPENIESAGVASSARLPVLKTPLGIYQGDAELFEWQLVDSNSAIDWSQPRILPNELFEQLKQKHIGDGLSLERILLDLHSGRIAGSVGVLFMDVIALLFLFLAIAGVWLWFKPKRSGSFFRG